MERENKGEATLAKLQLGELIRFTDVALVNIETRFGESVMVNFADKEGKVFRKVYAQGGMLAFLKQNPEAQSIVLKRQLKDGEYTYNVWSRE